MITSEHTTGAVYVASGTTVILGLTQEQWSILALIIGIILSVATFIINLYFKVQDRQFKERAEEQGRLLVLAERDEG